MKLEDVVEKQVLANALKFNGKANPKAVFGNVLAEFPDAKKDMKHTNVLIAQVAKKVNEMSFADQKKIIQQKYPQLLEKKEKKDTSRDIKELKNVGKKVVMRFSPSPSGPMHIGHAMTGGLTSIYVDKYKGDFILRIEDTNPDNIYPPAYDLLVQDADWIFGNVTETWIQSDRLEVYYKYVETFLKQGDCYVCECDPESFKKLITKKQACPCRECGSKEHLSRWKKMFDSNGYKQGDAVLRFKSDITHPNPAMRDFPLARINDSEHIRTEFQYRVWPLMNLSVFVDDVEANMTHIIRAKDHADNAKRQALMYKALGKQPPETYFVGRINFTGMELSASKTKERIEKGEFSGWDDIRLPFLGALKRRGYQPGAFKKYAKSIGLSLTDKTVSEEEFFKALDSFNKDIVDATSDRYFFIEKPINITIKGAPTREIHLKLHPEKEESDQRHFETNENFIIEKQDFDAIKDGELVRLMDCLNFTKKGKEFLFYSLDYETFKEKGKRIIHWLTTAHNADVEILLPNNTTKKGIAEESALQVQTEKVIQFERFGFCRLDKREDNLLKFWFTHK